jgi:hypothetical protein
MHSLYTLTGTYLELWRLAEQSDDGEIDPDLEVALAENQESIENKVDGYGKVMNSLLADAASCKMEAARLTQRQKGLENTAQRIKDNLQECLKALGTDRIKGKLFTATVQNSPKSLQIIDDYAIPPEYYDQPAPVLSKTRIKHALESGAEVPGAALHQGRHLRIK